MSIVQEIRILIARVRALDTDSKLDLRDQCATEWHATERYIGAERAVFMAFEWLANLEERER